MKKTLLIVSAIVLLALTILLLSKFINPEPEITRENFKEFNKTQIEKMGDELVNETREQHKNAEPVKFDDESVYDDIEMVEVEFEGTVIELPEIKEEVQPE